MRISPANHSYNESDPKYVDFDAKIGAAFPGWNVDTSLIETSRRNEYFWILSIHIRKPYNSSNGFIIERHIQWEESTIEAVLAAHTVEEIVAAVS